MLEKFKEFTATKSGVIAFDPEICVGCGTCELMCALYHEGVGGPALARCQVIRDPFNAEYRFINCQQCYAPSCYFACPLPDVAQCIEPETGVRYVDQEECVGCEECILACPFDPPRVRRNNEKEVAYQCDLCRAREAGPICVEYCPVDALTLVPGGERQ